MADKKIGIIGGTGLEDPDLLKSPNEVTIATPYGSPSSVIREGKINGVDVALLSRHGLKHTIPPTQVNNRANLWALKQVGCTAIIASTACGSLREDIGRGELVILDQFIDFTRHRAITFHDTFEPDALQHTPMADPFDKYIREKLIIKAKELNLKIHKKGTVITIEGPRFSTRAESNMFRIWGADVINMSTAPETILANELGIPYAAVAMSTDYDCWKTDEASVTWEEVLRIFKLNIENIKNLLVQSLCEL